MPKWDPRLRGVAQTTNADPESYPNLVARNQIADSQPSARTAFEFKMRSRDWFNLPGQEPERQIRP